MKGSTIKTLLFATAVTLSTAASADTRTIEVWNCKLLDGKTIEQVQSADAAWLAFVNGKVQGAGVRAYTMTSVVGDSAGFLAVDSFPSMAAWVEAKAALKTPEGQAVDAAWSSVAECTSNTLHESTES
jgi:hypothetical protein